jgi:hypothetical protein
MGGIFSGVFQETFSAIIGGKSIRVVNTFSNRGKGIREVKQGNGVRLMFGGLGEKGSEKRGQSDEVNPLGETAK